MAGTAQVSLKESRFAIAVEGSLLGFKWIGDFTVSAAVNKYELNNEAVASL